MKYTELPYKLWSKTQKKKKKAFEDLESVKPKKKYSQILKICP